ncbi:MAG TPA: FixG Ig-like domain-containing protein, partial [Herpetosiphonaceae bacterium]|nr:FixG Ig-like domain-containing protein [Herpetosiphonaceae bacterium]
AAAQAQLQAGQLTIGPASGSLTAGGQPVGLANGLAVAGYSGSIALSEATASADQLDLAGDAAFFTLSALPAQTTVDPSQVVSFTAAIAANFTDTYTVTAEAPAGWAVEVGAAGLITAVPPRGAAPGEYTILVTARSGAYPGLAVSALHTVTTTERQGMDFAVAPEPIFSVPFGPADPGSIPEDINNGRLQLTGAAYTVEVTNTSTTEHTFAVEVSGLPAGWVVLSTAEGAASASMTLPAGGVGRLGLYISPTLDVLPPAATEYPFTVQATMQEAPGLSQSASQTFRVPEIAFAKIAASPAVIYSAAGSAVSVDIGLRNIGNTAGDFPLSAALPSATWQAPLPAPQTVAAGAVVTQTVTLATPDGDVGRDYPVRFATLSGAYTQTATVLVRMVSPTALPFFGSASCAADIDNLPLAAALTQLGITVGKLEANPQDAGLRQQVVLAAGAVVGQLSDYEAISLDDDLDAAAAALQSHTDSADILADLLAMKAAVEQLCAPLDRMRSHGVRLDVLPGAQVSLPGTPVSYSVTLAARGVAPTTYDLSLEGLPAAWLATPLPASVTLQPAESATFTLAVVSDAVGVHPFQLKVQAREEPTVAIKRSLGLRVVDSLAAVTSVVATPGFVETGANSSAITVRVANVANWRMRGALRTSVAAPDGGEVWAATQPVTVSLNANQNTFAAGTLDT